MYYFFAQQKIILTFFFFWPVCFSLTAPVSTTSYPVPSHFHFFLRLCHLSEMFLEHVFSITGLFCLVLFIYRAYCHLKWYFWGTFLTEMLKILERNQLCFTLLFSVAVETVLPVARMTQELFLLE